MDHLVPIDSRGDAVPDWLNSPPMVRRDFVPREAVLGKGMFGTVWRAMDLRSRQWYAVKKSNTSRQPAIAREREVTNHVLMNPHPCIVQIFGNHYIETGSCFSSLVMEFCAGGDLQDKVNQAQADHGYRLPDQAITWLGQIFLGLVTWKANLPEKPCMLFGAHLVPVLSRSICTWCWAPCSETSSLAMWFSLTMAGRS